ncbi:MAG: hypothetical protein ACLTZ0_03910, partial [Dorea formicigenerans]
FVIQYPPSSVFERTLLLTFSKLSKNPFCLFIVVIQALKIPRKYIEIRNGTNLQDLGNIMLERIVPQLIYYVEIFS